MKAHAEEGIDTTVVLMVWQNLIMKKLLQLPIPSTDKDKVKAYKITAFRYMVAFYYNMKHNKILQSIIIGRYL